MPDQVPDERNQVPNQRDKIRALIATLREDLKDEELIKQAFADLNAQDRQSLRNHFEGRQEYLRQLTEAHRIVHQGIREYGLQTLKWLFLLNSGAVALILAYVAGAFSKSGASLTLPAFAPVLNAVSPFAMGCVLVAVAGAAGYLNFCYADGMLPGPDALHNFLDPNAKSFPLAKFQRVEESLPDFYRRFGWKADAARRVAIGCCFGSAVLFVLGLVFAFATLRS